MNLRTINKHIFRTEVVVEWRVRFSHHLRHGVWSSNSVTLRNFRLGRATVGFGSGSAGFFRRGWTTCMGAPETVAAAYGSASLGNACLNVVRSEFRVYPYHDSSHHTLRNIPRIYRALPTRLRVCYLMRGSIGFQGFLQNLEHFAVIRRRGLVLLGFEKQALRTHTEIVFTALRRVPRRSCARNRTAPMSGFRCRRRPCLHDLRRRYPPPSL